LRHTHASIGAALFPADALTGDLYAAPRSEAYAVVHAQRLPGDA